MGRVSKKKSPLLGRYGYFLELHNSLSNITVKGYAKRAIMRDGVLIGCRAQQ